MQYHKFQILAINPGSTSTKIGLFENIKPVFIKKIKHSADELRRFEHINDQYEYRKDAIIRELENIDFPLSNINIIMARGGLVKPIASGIYEVNEAMLHDLRNGVMGEHASNLGGLIAADIAKLCVGAKAYIADPVVVDELQEVARISGHPLFKNSSIFHALNQKAIARRHANSINRTYEDINLIIAHLGGGISVGAHCRGKVIDVNNALDGDGPFSPERSGSLPAKQLMELCFRGDYQKEDVEKIIVGEGGYTGYFGTNDAYEIEKNADSGDMQCRLIQEAMAYQVAKSIGSMAAVLKGEVEAILLTGGIANDLHICNYVRSMVNFIAPVIAYPGEDELSALAQNGLMLMKGTLQPLAYE
ncbi:MAG: butyrate kinase [Prevotellaceae bacterium]|jgi:butyrate kinase|nr:butyrate kinase [Prevotellaceae bacterium]